MSERLLDALDYWDILQHASVALLATGASEFLDWLGLQHLLLRRVRQAVRIALMLLALTMLVGATLTFSTLFELNPTWVYRAGVCIAWASAVITLAGVHLPYRRILQRERQREAEEPTARPVRAKRLQLLRAALAFAAGIFAWDRVLCGPLVYAALCSDRALVKSVGWGFNYDAPAMEPKNAYSGLIEQHILLQSSRGRNATREVVRTLQRTPAPRTRNGSSRVKLLFERLSQYPNEEAVRELSRWTTRADASKEVQTAAARALSSARARLRVAQAHQ